MQVTIEGMHCQACVQRVRRALEKIAGASIENVQVGSAVVTVSPSDESAVLEAVRKAGYQPRKSE
jgi:copper chaperone